MRIITRASGAQWFTVAWSFWYWAKFTLNWACFGKARWWCLHTASAGVVESRILLMNLFKRLSTVDSDIFRRNIKERPKVKWVIEITLLAHPEYTDLHRECHPEINYFTNLLLKPHLWCDWLNTEKTETRTLLKLEIRRVIGFYCFFFVLFVSEDGSNRK